MYLAPQPKRSAENMDQDLPQHILTIEALEDVVIFCKDKQNKIGWIKINRGLTERYLEFFGFHPD